MRKRRFLYEKTWEIGVFHEKGLTLFWRYGMYERQSVMPTEIFM